MKYLLVGLICLIIGSVGTYILCVFLVKNMRRDLFGIKKLNSRRGDQNEL